MMDFRKFGHALVHGISKTASEMHEEEKRSRAVEKAAGKMTRQTIEMLPFRSGIPNLPFADGVYPALHMLKHDAKAGRSYDAGTKWYATKEAASAMRSQIAELETMTRPSALGDADLPALRTKLGSIPVPKEGARDADMNHYVYIELMPPTPTGKAPKYPAIISFANTPIDGPMYHGKLRYLPDGSIGRADITYILDQCYVVSWRMAKGTLLPSSIVLKQADGPDIAIWRREQR